MNGSKMCGVLCVILDILDLILQVPGHEIVGIVREVESGVKKFKVPTTDWLKLMSCSISFTILQHEPSLLRQF
jgi:hypothetical protein